MHFAQIPHKISVFSLFSKPKTLIFYNNSHFFHRFPDKRIAIYPVDAVGFVQFFLLQHLQHNFTGFISDIM